jgi:hypothetical protein
VHGRIRLTASNDPELILTGEVGRADLRGGGRYAAWLFADKPFDWRGELRMPLMQHAVAARHGVDSDVVSVGFYFFETAEHQEQAFARTQIEAAREQVTELARALMPGGLSG